MAKRKIDLTKFDWWLIIAYLVMVAFGWMNIFSSVSGGEGEILDFSQKYGMHIIWISTSLILACLILFTIPSDIYSVLANGFYLLTLLLLIAVIFLGVEINGSHSWFAIGPVRLQPAEFSKISTSFALAALMSKNEFSFKQNKSLYTAIALIVIPMMIIVMEKETGSALVYLAFFLVMFREGMSGWILLFGLYVVLLFILTLILQPITTLLISIAIIAVFSSIYIKNKRISFLLYCAAAIVILSFMPKLLEAESVAGLTKFSSEFLIPIYFASISIIGLLFSLIKRNHLMRNSILSFLLSIAIVFSVDFLFKNVLKDYQQARIETLLGMRDDPMGVGYNVHQSLIAIGSGGFSGKGFLQGTQTRFNFVPEQSTDFIFCTIGEEWGFVGATAVLALYLFIILRLIVKAEQQKKSFSRIYGYCVACCIFMHVLINVGMTLGIAPVIGIPLPLLSYGGSSLWSFTALLFIFIRLDYDNNLS